VQTRPPNRKATPRGLTAAILEVTIVAKSQSSADAGDRVLRKLREDWEEENRNLFKGTSIAMGLLGLLILVVVITCGAALASPL
jgi:hypothetical protein